MAHLLLYWYVASNGSSAEPQGLGENTTGLWKRTPKYIQLQEYFSKAGPAMLVYEMYLYSCPTGAGAF